MATVYALAMASASPAVVRALLAITGVPRTEVPKTVDVITIVPSTLESPIIGEGVRKTVNVVPPRKNDMRSHSFLSNLSLLAPLTLARFN